MRAVSRPHNCTQSNKTAHIQYQDYDIACKSFSPQCVRYTASSTLVCSFFSPSAISFNFFPFPFGVLFFSTLFSSLSRAFILMLLIFRMQITVMNTEIPLILRRKWKVTNKTDHDSMSAAKNRKKN